MTDYPDGHGPDLCYGGICRSESDMECPFFPAKPMEVDIATNLGGWMTEAPHHEHDWRFAERVTKHMRFYCTKCLTVRDKDV